MSNHPHYAAKLSALGVYVPEKVVTNDDLAHWVDTSAEWIRSRTGISERHVAGDGECNSDLSARAVRNLLERRQIEPEEIELIIVATVTPDMFFPSTACVLQEKIGAKNAWCFDLSGACSGFLYALTVGAQFITTGVYRKVLIVGTDIMTSILNFEDRTTCVLFGDGSGAALLEPLVDGEKGIIDSLLKSDGTGGKYLALPGGGSLHPSSHETVEKKMHFVHQDGKQVFRFAVRGMTQVCQELLNRHHVKPEDLALYVPHQANKRIIDASVIKLGLNPAQVVVNIDRYANTTAATIPLCLDEAHQEGRLKKGDLVLMASFGAGFTSGSILMQWEM